MADFRAAGHPGDDLHQPDAGRRRGHPRPQRNLYAEALDARLRHPPRRRRAPTSSTRAASPRRSSTSPRRRRARGRVGVLRDMAVKFGASGWMADFAEQTPFAGRFANGASGATEHNRFPDRWSEVQASALRRPPRRRRLPPRGVRHEPALGAAVLDGRPDGELERARRHALGADRDALRRHVGLRAQPLRHRRLHDARRPAGPAQRGAAGPLVGDERLRRRDVPHRTRATARSSTSSPTRARASPAPSRAGRGSSARSPPTASGLEREAARTGMPIVRPLWFSDARPRRRHARLHARARRAGRARLRARRGAHDAAAAARPLGARLDRADVHRRPRGHRRLAARAARPSSSARGRASPRRSAARRLDGMHTR